MRIVANCQDLSAVWDAQWRTWLRHCAASRKVASSIPGGVTGISHSHNPFRRIMALGSTKPLTEMSTRNISWGGKDGQCVGLTTLSRSCADYLEMWEPELPGTLRVCPDLLQGLFNLIRYLCVDTCVILLVYVWTPSLYYLFMCGHLRYITCLYVDTCVVLLVYVWTSALYYLFMCGHLRYITYLFCKNVVVI